MMKSIAAGLTGLAILAGPVLAQSTCEPAKLSAAVDRYAAEPFSARSWRVLQGLGDPMIDPTTADADTWANQEEWKKLVSQILPDHQDLQNVGWDCRIGYPLTVLKKRIDQLGAADPYVKQWLLAQEQVLHACSSQDGDVALPPPLADEDAVANRQKADRAYQEASIAFYRDKQKAIPMFQDTPCPPRCIVPLRPITSPICSLMPSSRRTPGRWPRLSWPTRQWPPFT